MIEALQNINVEDFEDIEELNYLQFTLMSTQENILRVVSTRRPSQFLAEYTKSLIGAVQRASMMLQEQYLMPYIDFIKHSMLDGAIARFLHLDKVAKEELQCIDALMRGFLTYVLVLTEQVADPPRSFTLFQHTHSNLVVRRGGDEIQASEREHVMIKLAIERISDTDTLWDCGAWALAEDEAVAEGHSQDSVDGLDEADIQLSPAGSAILLSYILEDAANGTDEVRQVGRENKIEKCSQILFELCVRQTPSPATLDSCLVICSKVLGDVAEGTTTPLDSDSYLLFLQTLSSICATASHPMLRHVAHFLVKDALTLTSHDFRLQYYLGVLADCPYPVLRTATVGLLKDDYASDDEFWRDQARVVQILQAVFSARLTTEFDEQQAQYVVQALAFLTLILRRSADSFTDDMVSTGGAWVDIQAKSTAQSDMIDPLTAGLLSMHISRVRELMSTPKKGSVAL